MVRRHNSSRYARWAAAISLAFGFALLLNRDSYAGGNPHFGTAALPGRVHLTQARRSSPSPSRLLAAWSAAPPRVAAAPRATPWEGLRWDPSEPVRPPDCAVAKSTSHILQVVNSRLTVLNQQGRIIFDDGAGNNFLRLRDLFSTVAGTDDVEWFGPRCLYDDTSGRFVLAVAGADFANKDEAWLGIAVSAGPDPLQGGWTVYGYRTDFEGETQVPRWADELDLGTNGSFLAITWNERLFSTNALVQSRLRSFDKAGLLDGSSAEFADVLALRDSAGALAFTVRPARHYGTNDAFYLASSRAIGGDALELWRLTGTPDSPVLTPASVTGVQNYAPPPNARQPGVPVSFAQDAIETGDCRVLCAVADDNRVWTTLNSLLDGVVPDAAIHITEIDGATGAMLQSRSIGARGTDYYFASLATTTGRKAGAVIVFGSSSSKIGAGLRYSTRTHTMASGRFKTSKQLLAGNGRYDPLAPRDPTDPQPPVIWGRYTTAVRDPAKPEQVLVAGPYANSKKTRDVKAWATRLKFLKP
jgi:hypothetical protein